MKTKFSDIGLLKEQNKFPRSLYNRDKWNLTVNFIKNNLKRGSSVLDVGCGASQLCTIFGSKYDMFGIDIDKAAIKNFNPRKYKAADVQKKIPFRNNKFDCVVMLEIIEHIKYSDSALKEIKRVLKKNGFLILSTPNYNSLLWRFVELAYKIVFGFDIKKVHINKYNLKRLKYQLPKYFSIIEIGKMSYGMGLFAVCKNK